MSDVTRLLQNAAGDPKAAEDLLPMVYEELRRLAASRMAAQPPGQTLQATALVHEAWLRLTQVAGAQWNSRGHFFAAAAEAMRRIIVERTRRKLALKRGAGESQEEFLDDCIAVSAPSQEILQVHEALDLLTQVDPKAAQLVKLRYFVGLTTPEAAEALDLSVRGTERLWTFAKTWLHRQLQRPD